MLLLDKMYFFCHSIGLYISTEYLIHLLYFHGTAASFLAASVTCSKPFAFMLSECCCENYFSYCLLVWGSLSLLLFRFVITNCSGDLVFSTVAIVNPLFYLPPVSSMTSPNLWCVVLEARLWSPAVRAYSWCIGTASQWSTVVYL